MSRRLARLFEEKSIRVVGFVPPEYLGYHMQAALFLRSRSDPETLAKRLAALPQFTMVMTAFGFCDVIAYGIAQHGPALAALLDSHIHGQPDVAESDMRVILGFAEPALQPGAPGATSAPRPLDSTDRRIIREVQSDGRVSFTDLATAIGISPTSAADRFRRLVTDGIVRVLGMPDPRRVGLLLTGYMHFKVDQSSTAVISGLSKLPEIGFVTIMSGEWPVACEFMVRNDAHLDDLQKRVMATPGVHEIRVALHRHVHRMSMVFEPANEAALDQDSAAAPAAPPGAREPGGSLQEPRRASA
ncbi:MAG: Lrp/AsnC family transcriptional regulator [Phycisphaerae bacterium]|nr:Lrp/AsnC family transcriptional regulator [Phycisphaerae bacterium]